jgi:hypothetical protein
MPAVVQVGRHCQDQQALFLQHHLQVRHLVPLAFVCAAVGYYTEVTITCPPDESAVVGLLSVVVRVGTTDKVKPNRCSFFSTVSRYVTPQPPALLPLTKECGGRRVGDGDGSTCVGGRWRVGSWCIAPRSRRQHFSLPFSRLHIVYEQPLTARARKQVVGRARPNECKTVERRCKGTGAADRTSSAPRTTGALSRAAPRVLLARGVCGVGWWLRSRGDHECRCDVRQSGVLLLACLSQSNAPTQVVRDVHGRTR